jgi:hypothetical protein
MIHGVLGEATCIVSAGGPEFGTGDLSTGRRVIGVDLPQGIGHIARMRGVSSGSVTAHRGVDRICPLVGGDRSR